MHRLKVKGTPLSHGALITGGGRAVKLARQLLRIEGGMVGSRPARHRYCRCGTQLAADNSERQCARCQRATRDKFLTPPQVPAEFWRAD